MRASAFVRNRSQRPSRTPCRAAPSRSWWASGSRREAQPSPAAMMAERVLRALPLRVWPQALMSRAQAALSEHAHPPSLIGQARRREEPERIESLRASVFPYIFVIVDDIPRSATLPVQQALCPHKNDD